MSQVSTEFIPTRIAILTVSNRRGEEDDTSGHYLRDSAQEAGHHVVDKAIVKENRYAIRAQVSAWIASDDVQVVLITGGTGLTEGDQAPEALLPLFDREIEGFGEVFRMLSFEEIGTSTYSHCHTAIIQSHIVYIAPAPAPVPHLYHIPYNNRIRNVSVPRPVQAYGQTSTKQTC